jgi:hypothetical protein
MVFKFKICRMYVLLAASQVIAFATSAGVLAPACRNWTATPVAWGQAIDVPWVMWCVCVCGRIGGGERSRMGVHGMRGIAGSGFELLRWKWMQR